MSYCAKCEKAVRVIIEDLISANELKQFNKEVEQMKLQVKYIVLLKLPLVGVQNGDKQKAYKVELMEYLPKMQV